MILPLGRDSVKPTTPRIEILPLSNLESVISDPSTPDQLSIQLYVISIARAGQWRCAGCLNWHTEAPETAAIYKPNTGEEVTP